tara:strand:- start:41 stop:418 length:378 start_codon:yes stop_codon:yes gene_type:complete
MRKLNAVLFACAFTIAGASSAFANTVTLSFKAGNTAAATYLASPEAKLHVRLETSDSKSYSYLYLRSYVSPNKLKLPNLVSSGGIIKAEFGGQVKVGKGLEVTSKSHQPCGESLMKLKEGVYVAR